MSRYQIEVRHGSNGPAQWGAVVALIVLVVYAAAGNHRIGAMLHEVLTVAEIIALSAVGFTVLALAVRITTRRRRAARRLAREQALIAAAWDRHFGVAPAHRPALDAPHCPTWPTPAEWDEIHRRADYHRNS